MIELDLEMVQNIKDKNMIVLTFHGKIEHYNYKFGQVIEGQITPDNSASIIQDAYLRLAMNLEMMAEVAKQKAQDSSSSEPV